MAASLGDLDALDAVLAGVHPLSALSAALRLAREFQGRLTANAVPIYDEALLRLARASQVDVRIQLSHRLAPFEAGPVRTVSDLALDLDPAVATPILRRSILVSEVDLVTVCCTRGQAHLAAVAERADLPDSVRQGIVARGSEAVRCRLQGTIGVPLPPSGRHEETRPPEQPPRSSGRPASREMPDGSGQDRSSSLQPSYLPSRPAYNASDSAASKPSQFTDERLRTAEARVDAFARDRPLTPSVASHWILSGSLVEGLVAVARLAGEDPTTLAEAVLLTNRRSNLPLLAMRAGEVPWVAVMHIARVLNAGTTQTMRAWTVDLSRHRDGYERLSKDAAQRALCALRARGKLRVVGGNDTKAM